MAKRSRSFWAHYGVAVLSIVVATLSRGVFLSLVGESYPFATILLAIIFSAWYGGFGPSVTASILGLATLFLIPAGRPAGQAGGSPLGLVVYSVLTLAIAWFGGLMAAARQKVEEEAEEIERQREQLRATLASIGDAVIVTDATGRITSLNAVAEILTGYGSAEAAGHPLEEIFRIINQATRETVESPVARVLREGSIVGLANHTLLIAKDGSERPIDDSAAPILDVDGQLFGVVLVFRDVTQRRSQEEQLRVADRRKDEFLAILAHELRNPLAPISNALEILKLPTAEPAVTAEAREVAQRQLAHLTRLVDDLLDVSRIMRGKTELRRECVQFSAIAAQAVETARPLIDQQRHELHVSVPEYAVWLEADRVRLAQVLANLLSNAAKYTEPGGEIWLTAEVEQDQLLVRVRDTGIGISPEMLPRLFDMFMQVAPGESRSQGGLGIGLTLVKNLVEMHGGSVEAHSAGLGQGSEFVVRLRLTAEQPQVEPHTPVPKEVPADRPRRGVLVVDDNVDAAESLAVLLRLQGHEVQVAHGGAEALIAARVDPPELVFLDIGMPEMNGYEVAKQMRTEFGLSMSLVALTGWGTEQDRQRAHEAGFDCHLTKPVDLRSLTAVLDSPPGAAQALESAQAIANDQ